MIRTKFGPYRAAGFDLDGTLVRTSGAHLAARLKRLAERCGIEFTAAVPERARAASWHRGGPAYLREVFMVNDETAHYLWHEWEELDIEHPPALHQGARDTLDWCAAQDMPLYVVTARHARSTYAILRATGVLNYFTHICTREDVMATKPEWLAFHPSLMHLAYVHGVGNEWCLYVGDSVDDLLAGRSAEIRTVIVKTGDFESITPEHELSDDHVIESVAELPGWFKRMAA